MTTAATTTATTTATIILWTTHKTTSVMVILTNVIKLFFQSFQECTLLFSMILFFLIIESEFHRLVRSNKLVTTCIDNDGDGSAASHLCWSNNNTAFEILLIY